MGIRLLVMVIVFASSTVVHHHRDRLASEPRQYPRADYGERLRQGLVEPERAERWLQAGEHAIEHPVTIGARRYGETGAFSAEEIRAAAFRIPVASGERLRIALVRVVPVTDVLFAELYREGGDGWEHVASLGAEARSLILSSDEARDFLLLLQPRLSLGVRYQLELSRGGSLPFPVADAGVERIWSFFGDERAGGARLHEGVDVFVDRGTPVYAVSDGYVRTGELSLGGKIIWLFEPGSGIKYYYAHLDTIAVPNRVRVAQGDLLGTVGNTGNARTTPPHLHFGIYRPSRGAVDPLPYLQPPPERDFLLAELPDNGSPATGPQQVTASALNIRSGPEPTAPVVTTVTGDSILRVVASGPGPWRRVHLGDGRDGFAHRDWLAAPDREEGVLAWQDDQG